jgi:hypothetical protein
MAVNKFCGNHAGTVRRGTLNMVLYNRNEAVLTADSSDHVKTPLGQIISGAPMCKSAILRDKVAVIMSGDTRRDNKWSALSIAQSLSGSKPRWNSLAAGREWAQKMKDVFIKNENPRTINTFDNEVLGGVFVSRGSGGNLELSNQTLVVVTAAGGSKTFSTQEKKLDLPRSAKNSSLYTGGSGGNIAYELAKKFNGFVSTRD